MVSYFVVRTLNHLVLVELLYALEAERVSTWQGYWFLVVMVVGLETDATLEY